MPRPRSQLVDLESTNYYHCFNRCVRQLFLFGEDENAAHNFDYRKGWIVERIEQLTHIFAIGCCSYGLMSNHMHLVLRLQAEIAAAWSAGEVAERYAALFKPTVERARKLPAELYGLRVAVWRRRLFDLSWFMRCLDETIARRANREDGTKGHFWQGRFRSQALLDVEALMTCMTYVDLNPIRAGISRSLEDSQFTSIQARLIAATKPGDKELWLLPFADQTAPIGVRTTATGESPIAIAAQMVPLPFHFEDYCELLRWTADEVTVPRVGEQTRPTPQAFEKFKLSGEGFVDMIRQYPQRFFTMVGSAHQIDLEATRRGYKRIPGIVGVRKLYRERG